MTRISIAIIAALLAGVSPAGAANFPDASARLADYDFLVDQIAAHYAYLPERHLNLAQLRQLYRHEAETATTRAAFVHVIEEVVGELHDHHATLGTNTPSSPQLIPTGTDIWAEIRNGRAVITEVRLGSPAAKAGVKPGDVVISIAGVKTQATIAQHLPKGLTGPDPEAANFTLRTLLAGTHDARRRFAIADAQQGPKAIDLPPYEAPQASTLVTAQWLDKGIGYIRIENSLGDSDTVAAFDAALTKLSPARALILDLRNTPSGGSSDVAEPILARFITTTSGYQRVFEPGPGKSLAKDSWLKTIAPRLPTITAKLVVLSGHWTGSMGEGMTIGLDAVGRAKTVGTAMAALCGGTGSFTLPHSQITVHFPIERLYHVDGTPREIWQPRIAVSPTAKEDAILARGIEEARK